MDVSLGEKYNHVISVGKDLVDSGDSTSGCTERFSHTVMRLMDSCIDINNNFGEKAPVPQILVSTLKAIVQNLDAETFEKIIKIFAERALPLIEEIKNKNMPKFIENAPVIFEEVPTFALNSVVQILNEDKLSKKDQDYIFSIIHPLTRMAIKYQSITAYEESLFVDSSGEKYVSSVNIPVVYDSIVKFGISAPKN